MLFLLLNSTLSLSFERTLTDGVLPAALSNSLLKLSSFFFD
jgi:hypothetical protein